jgi:tetratricopeptide (TPR) repeat protein
LHVRGWLAANQGDLQQARDFYIESLNILRKVGDTWTSADPTGALGWVFYCLGEYDTASAYLQQALAIYRAAEDKFSTPGIYADLGSVAFLLGKEQQAIKYFETSLTIAREVMNKKRIASTLCDLGIAVGHCGDQARAMVFLREGLELSQQTGNLYLIAACLIALAGLQQPRHAAQILAAAQAAFERSGEFIEPLYRIERQRVENKIREIINQRDFVKLLQEGHSMTVEQAVALALETT